MRPSAPARPAGVPLPLPDELDRRRLLDQIDARWRHPVTVVVAGAGFGKSTVLAQAVRANALEPRGIDIWHGCTPGDVDADVLGRALLIALGLDSHRPDLVAHLIDALTGFSPIDVCLVLDDAHEIRPGSSGADLISRLVRQLPDNAHVVLAARDAPPGALARLRAADRLVEISEADLAFTRAETEQLAARLGRDPTAARALGGWPALVRLSLAARPDVAANFAQEEVLGRLSAPERLALFALANLGYADLDRVRYVVGSDIDLDHLAATVPLVSRTEDGLFRAHDLWSATLMHVLDREQTTELRARVIEQLVADGDLARAGAIASAHHDLDALATIALEVVSRTIAALPIDTVRPWSRELQRARPDAPETRVVLAAIAQAVDFTDVRIDAELDTAAAAFRARGEPNGEIVAYAVGTVAAHARGDVGRLVAIAEQASAIPGAAEHPVLNLAVHSIAAVVAEMGGDLDGALAELRAAQIDRVPPVVGRVGGRLLIHNLLLAGRAPEAAEVARRMVTDHSDKTARYLLAVSRWMAGEPSELIALGRPTVDVPALNSRDGFVRRTLVALLLASTGQRDEVHRVVEGQDAGTRLRPTSPTPATPCWMRSPMPCAPSSTTTRRRRPTWSRRSTPGTPVARSSTCTCAASCRSATCWCPSSGRVGTTPRSVPRTRRPEPRLACCSTSGPAVVSHRWTVDPARIFTELPLVWSIELACRLHANRHPAGARLGTWLVEQVPEPARAELRHLADAADPVGRAAGDLLAHLPAVPSRPARDLGPGAAAGRLRRRGGGRSRAAPGPRPDAASAPGGARPPEPRARHRPPLAGPRRPRRRPQPARHPDVPAPAPGAGTTGR